MQSIVDQANKIKKKEREEIILEVLSGVLMLIPFGGEEAGAAGLAATQMALRLISDIGDIAMSLYGVVSDPKNVFNDIFGVLGVAGAGRDVFKAAAVSRRAMKSEDLAKLGPIKVKLDKADDVSKCVCNKKA